MKYGVLPDNLDLVENMPKIKKATDQPKGNIDLFEELAETGSADALSSLLECSDEVFIKKMALNDWEWTEKSNKHQNGPLIPTAVRDSGFFPPLEPQSRKPGEKPILMAQFNVLWPQTGEILEARLAHYTSKNEAHLTHVPRSLFTGISPASFVIFGRKKNSRVGEYPYQAVIIDSASDDAYTLTDLFELHPMFLSGIFLPRKIIKSYQDRILDFIEQALAAFNGGDLKEFTKQHASLPEPNEMAMLAQNKFKKQNAKILDFNPFSMDNPGDCLMEISRGIELEIFREYELRQRSLELIHVILGDDPKKNTIESVFRKIIYEFPRIDKILLSASQTRKARAGRSFEYHIETMLVDGKIPHKVQMIMSSKRRPDFILPTFELYNKKDRPSEHALVLSAKTTLRERWKQVQNEINNCDLYLATVDDKIAENAIASMSEAGIRLVVPESLKSSPITAYKGQDNVISFKEFFMIDVKKNRYPLWAPLGLLD